jgi:hypothetical protein
MQNLPRVTSLFPIAVPLHHSRDPLPDLAIYRSRSLTSHQSIPYWVLAEPTREQKAIHVGQLR